MEPLTREQAINRVNALIESSIHYLDDKAHNDLIMTEIRNHDTNSDSWFDLSEEARKSDSKTAKHLFDIAVLVLNRNCLHDGSPYCPLCGGAGIPEHNGEPVINAKVCSKCHYFEVLKGRLQRDTI